MVMLLTDEQKAVYNLVASGNALKNPLIAPLNTLVSTSNSVLSQINTLTTVPTTQKDDLEESLTNFLADVNNFITHTNRISGAVNSYSSTIPYIHQLLAVSRSRQQLKLQFGNTEAYSLASGLELFQSLYFSVTTLAGMNAFLNSIIVRLQNSGEEAATPLVEPPDNPLVPGVISYLDTLGPQMNSVANATDAAYNTALNELRTASMMYELTTQVDPVSTTMQVIQDQNGTTSLLEIIEEIQTPSV